MSVQIDSLLFVGSLDWSRVCAIINLVRLIAIPFEPARLSSVVTKKQNKNKSTKQKQMETYRAAAVEEVSASSWAGRQGGVNHDCQCGTPHTPSLQVACRGRTAGDLAGGM